MGGVQGRRGGWLLQPRVSRKEVGVQYLGCECSEAACRGLAGSIGSLRDLALGGQVSSGVGGAALLAGEG